MRVQVTVTVRDLREAQWEQKVQRAREEIRRARERMLRDFELRPPTGPGWANHAGDFRSGFGTRNCVNTVDDLFAYAQAEIELRQADIELREYHEPRMILHPQVYAELVAAGELPSSTPKSPPPRPPGNRAQRRAAERAARRRE